LKSAVLMVVFNRPDCTREVFEAVRAARPPRLYITADGPRASRPAEAARCEEVREIASAVDWPCEVKTRFLDKNLGCKRGVSSGIDWFFENEEEGIILEDDVVPVPSFFIYCDELLERYRNDQRVMHIGGDNPIWRKYTPKESYFFSKNALIWGWATWRRAWKHYDVTIRDWPAWRDEGGLKRLAAGDSAFERFWRSTFNAGHRGAHDTWDYQWMFTCWRHNGLCAVPARSQTHNIGFGADATHTTEGIPQHVIDSYPEALDLPLIHPSAVARSSVEIEKLIEQHVWGISPMTAFKRELRSMPWVGDQLESVRKYFASKKSVAAPASPNPKQQA